MNTFPFSLTMLFPATTLPLRYPKCPKICDAAFRGISHVAKENKKIDIASYLIHFFLFQNFVLKNWANQRRFRDVWKNGGCPKNAEVTVYLKILGVTYHPVCPSTNSLIGSL